MPVKISIPMFQDLMKSLEKEKLEFDYWLFVAKVFQEGNKTERIYVNPEEEIFEEFGECKCEMAQPNAPAASTSTGKALRSTFSIFLMPTSKINDALNKVISLSQ